jgi:rhamnosyltransferase
VKVTVIMRTKDSDWVVDQALVGLFSQSFRDFDVLVVDSGSRDRTLELVGRHPVRVHRIAPGSYVPGVVLNDAIERTDADILVFQNSDVVPLGPDTLARLLEAFDDPRVDAAFARQVPRPEAHAWVRRDYEVAFPPRGPAPSFVPYSLPLAAMRRSAWRARRFHENVWASEDSAWGTWAKAHGRVVRYVPEACVMHSHNYTLREIYGRRFVEGEADAFIQPEARFGAGSALRRFVGSVARDIAYALSHRDAAGALAAPARRAAYQAAYLRGRRHGEARRLGREADADLGRRVVLERHGGAGASERRGT